jgi:hypothetical protein
LRRIVKITENRAVAGYRIDAQKQIPGCVYGINGRPGIHEDLSGSLDSQTTRELQVDRVGTLCRVCEIAEQGAKTRDGVGPIDRRMRNFIIFCADEDRSRTFKREVSHETARQDWSLCLVREIADDNAGVGTSRDASNAGWGEVDHHSAEAVHSDAVRKRHRANRNIDVRRARAMPVCKNLINICACFITSLLMAFATTVAEEAQQGASGRHESVGRVPSMETRSTLPVH